MKTNFRQASRVSADGDAGNSGEAKYGFDRVTVWLDRPESLLLQRPLLERYCTRIKIEVCQMPHQARWKCRLEIFQPTRKCLEILQKAVGNDIAVLVHYVEIACDLPPCSKRKALVRRNAFLASAKMRYQHQSVTRHLCTYYFGRRTDVKKHRPNVLAVYADRPSKLGNARPAKGTPPCLHIEWRVSGSPALEGYGIVSLDDLIQFDHPRFWNEHIRLYQLPKPTPLGQLLANACGADSGVSGSALRKRAAQWRNKYSLCENFVMHNAIRETPGVEKKLKTIAFSAWLEEVISL